MSTVKIYLKGWRDGRLFCDATNDSTHELHAEAWKVRDQLWTPYKPGDEIYHAITYTATDDRTDQQLLEDAFEMFNVGSGPIVDEYRAAGNRSLSMGDVVVVGVNAYTCAAVGWEPVENFSPPFPK